jgi:hypothetical protein
MTTPPRPATLEGLCARLALLETAIYGPVQDFKKTGEPAIVRVIRGVASQVLREEKALRDTGTWDREKLYGPGAMTTYDGAIWVCQIEAKAQQPGTGAAWRLAHKAVDVALRKEIKAMVRDELRRKQERDR